MNLINDVKYIPLKNGVIRTLLFWIMEKLKKL